MCGISFLLNQVCLSAANLIPTTAFASRASGFGSEHTFGSCSAAPPQQVHCAPSRPAHSLLCQCQDPRGVLRSGQHTRSLSTFIKSCPLHSRFFLFSFVNQIGSWLWYNLHNCPFSIESRSRVCGYISFYLPLLK